MGSKIGKMDKRKAENIDLLRSLKKRENLAFLRLKQTFSKSLCILMDDHKLTNNNSNES